MRDPALAPSLVVVDASNRQTELAAARLATTRLIDNIEVSSSA